MESKQKTGLDGNGRLHPLSAGTGWSAISQTVRDADEAKVRDCKEDIDTLLVFAGLFSAVLTAFVIESYKLLQQDNSDIMVRLLQQIVDQTSSYRILDNQLNTSAPPLLAATPFRPPTFAVQVNVLWFASLTISLMTASFGMLVKQWLREYMAVDYLSPQARLRARHFRHPGIRDWKVFEIAALLPVLLQVALAFFFLGLCFFTWSVHSSIGHTTVPLVSGWAMLLAFIILAPLLSPRCPFKMPLLTALTKFLRVKLLWWMTRGYSRVARSRIGWIKATPNLHWDVHKRTDPFEEEAVISNGEKDVEILTFVDATLSDDRFVVHTMWSSLLESNTDALNLLLFIKGILGNRIECTIVKLALPIDLRDRRLMVTHWQTIVGLATELIEREIHRFEDSSASDAQWSNVMVESLLLVLSPVPAEYEYPETAFNRICGWLRATHVRIAMCNYFNTIEDKDKALLLLNILENNVKRWWKVLDSRYLDVLNDFIAWASNFDQETADLRLLTAQLPSTLPSSMVLSRTLSNTTLRIHKRIMLPQIMSSYRAWYRNEVLPDFPPSLDVSLASFLNRLEATGFSHGLMSNDGTPGHFVVRTVRDVLLAFFGLSAANQFFLGVFARRQTLCIDDETAHIMQRLLRRTRSVEPTYISVAVQDGSRFAFDFIHVLDAITGENANKDIPVRVLRLCYLAFMMVVGPKSMAMSLHYLAWRITFSRISMRLSGLTQQASFVVDQEIAFLAGQCLYQVDLLEGVSGDPNGLRYCPEDDRWPYPAGTVFGEDLIRILSCWADNPLQYACVQQLALVEDCGANQSSEYEAAVHFSSSAWGRHNPGIVAAPSTDVSLIAAPGSGMESCTPTNDVSTSFARVAIPANSGSKR